MAAIAPVMPADELQAKTAELWQILQTLVAADSGWPADQPQTPETLLPYLTDEVEDLLAALPAAAIADATTAQPVERPRLLSALSADWLWAIAASSPAGMKLLEGGAASIHEWPQAYGLRLVPTLKIQHQGQDYALDLTTQGWGAVATVFAPETTIQLLDLPGAPIVSAATLQDQIRDRTLALVPALCPWFAGLTVDLQLPGIPWTTAAAQLVLHLVPLTTQVAPPPVATTVLSHHSEPPGLPTARIWEAKPPQSTAIATATATLVPTSPSPPWTLDSELTWVDAAALTPSIQSAHQLALGRQLAALARSPAALTPLALVDAVMQAQSSPEQFGLTLGQSPLPLSELCHQVKWLWIQASQLHMPLLSGLPARHLHSGQTWQSGTLVSQGQLVLLDGDRAIAALDVATSEWTSPDSDLEAADCLQVTLITEPDAPLWRVDQLTQHINQSVQERSPLLASLMARHRVKLWSPQDDLFPEMMPPELCLRWQIVLRFLPSLL